LRQRLQPPQALALPEDASAQTVDDLWQTLWEQVEAHAHEDLAAERWHDLITRLQISAFEGQVLAWLCAMAVDLPTCRAWRYGWADVMQPLPTWGFASHMLRATARGAVSPRNPDALPILRGGLVHLSAPASMPNAPHSERALVIDPDTLAFLCGWSLADDRFVPFDAVPSPPQRLQKPLLDKLRLAPTWPKPARASLICPPGADALSVAAQVALACGVRDGLWRLSLTALSARRDEATIQRALRMASLRALAVVVEGLDALTPQELSEWHHLIDGTFRRAEVVVIWVSSQPLPDLFGVSAQCTYQIGYPTRAQRLAVWRDHVTASLGLEDAGLQQLASRYLLAEDHIRALCDDAAALVALASTPDERLAALCDRARALASLGLGQLAQPSSSRVTLADIFVSDETKAELQEIIDSARNAPQLAKLFAGKVTAGLGITCLFAGPSGTGKTLCAQAIANALGLELYQIDLSQVVSKYIGETEKQLGALFTAAESGEAVLLFDEADSLFSKRTEVKNSTDRYANQEVNYLLQRIERFNGISILTTNFETGIDDAFKRRIRFRVGFEQPDAPTRLRLWQALLPQTLQAAADVDLSQLAEVYALSGGHIKEVLVRAAAAALSQDPPRITHDLLRRCADLEYKKLGKLPVSGAARPRAGRGA
jgi:AAA+ superfamily predicted ATPase